MMISGNINLNALIGNLTCQNSFQPNNTDEFDLLFNELLKMFTENKDLVSEQNLVVFPASFISLPQILQNFLMQPDGNVELNPEFVKILQKFQINPAQIKLFEKIQDSFKNTAYMADEKLIESALGDFKSKDNQFKIAFDIIQNSKDIQTTDDTKQNEITKLYLELSKSMQVDEKTMQTENNGKIKLDFENLHARAKILDNDSLSSNTNLVSNVSTVEQNQTIPNKIELPVTKLSELSDVIFKTLSSSNKTLTIQLEPPELGRILIKLSLDSAGIKADMKVDYPHVKEMLTGLIPEIKSNLQSSGIKVSDFLLDLARDPRGYGDSYNGQGQRKYKGNQKFYDYFV